MTGGELQRLRAEVRSDRQAFESHVREIESLSLAPASPGDLARGAVALHHAYGAVEAAFARVAGLLEGSVPSGADWHGRLLHAMSLEIPSVRPAVLGPSSRDGLRRLLAFRHFFRHAYSVDLDPEQPSELRRVAVEVRAPLGRDLDALDDFLAALASELDQ